MQAKTTMPKQRHRMHLDRTRIRNASMIVDAMAVMATVDRLSAVAEHKKQAV